MIAYFAAQTGCPAGWTPATSVEGRMIVGTDQNANVGATVGTALGNLEDRTHTHPFTSTLNIPVANSSLVDGSGCLNTDGAHSGNHNVNGTTDAATTGLPFAQLLACRRP